MHILPPATRSKYASLSGGLKNYFTLLRITIKIFPRKTLMNWTCFHSLFTITEKICFWESHYLPSRIRVLCRYMLAVSQFNYMEEEELKYWSLLTVIGFIISIICIFLQLTAFSPLNLIKSNIWASPYPAGKKRTFLTHKVQT